ncbi:hypothetical protein, partial [Pantoea agglomerans]|uniref:hypothetical protein n=1 Tax=Enterobacter agglomerans TaxID=549 RepID=UPI001A7E8E24
FLVILFTSLSKSLVSRIPGAVQDDKLRTVVDVVTVFDKTIRLTTRQKSPRYFRDCVQALETLSSYTGENRNVKVKVIE